MSCCGDRACSHAVVAAATAEATRLTDKEREIILDVLGRDELLRRNQQVQVMHLKAELQSLRRKGALKPSADQGGAGPDPARSCGRCRVALGRVINRGAFCQACRLRVCKGCRQFSFKTTDWVCIVCHKHMEIQATSGEWMNEFVRRPSRRRENLPAADVIKRTIRRSWTISNPTIRWTGLRCSPEHRPYNSLPRSQGASDYPSLALHQANLTNQPTPATPPSHRKISPAKRTQSEDVYHNTPPQTPPPGDPRREAKVSPRSQTRVNPLMRIADQKRAREGKRPQKKSSEGSSEEGSSKEEGGAVEVTSTTNSSKKADGLAMEKRVSFGSNTAMTTMEEDGENVSPARSSRGDRPPMGNQTSSACSEEAYSTMNELQYASEETAPAPDRVELCDIEPISGTVFRKVTVRRRQLSSSEGGWRRGHQDPDLPDVLPPDGDDYKLVFINTSDGSSKEETSSKEEEEEDDEDDSHSTASSFPLDECDWDYFEPGAGVVGRAHGPAGWASSPFGSPRVGRRAALESPIGSPIVYRRRLRESDPGTDSVSTTSSDSPAAADDLPSSALLPCAHDTPPRLRACRHCGSPARFIPVPVPVPVPIPVWAGGGPPHHHHQRPTALPAHLLPGHLLPLLAHLWRGAQNDVDRGTGSMPLAERAAAECENDSSDSGGDREGRRTVYAVNGDDDDSASCSSDGEHFSRVFVVNDGSSCDEDTEDDATAAAVVLTHVKRLSEDEEEEDGLTASRERRSSSPGLSDLDAESLRDSSEAEAEKCGGEASGRSPESRCAATRYTSLVMITQQPVEYRQVSVVTSDTTTLVPDQRHDVVVRHTNGQEVVQEEGGGGGGGETNDNRNHDAESVTVITGGETLSAFEEGLADDDSWVENLSHDDDDEDDFATNSSENTSSSSSSGDEVTLTCSSAAVDQEEDLRGYHRTAIDFTLHTIVEESCEESEAEHNHKERPISATDLEKYFFFGLGDGAASHKEDAFSETSSVYSEGVDSLPGGPEGGGRDDNDDDDADSAELASSRLEKYFLSGFMGFTAAERRDSDGSVGSDSEGRPSPEQRRKRLVRARGTGRSHSSSSLDNLDNAGSEPTLETQINSEDSSSSDSEVHDDAASGSFEKPDGQFDTVKRKKGNKKQKPTAAAADDNNGADEDDDDDRKTPQPETSTTPSNLTTTTNQQSRDSGFVGSCDDLVREQPESPPDVAEERKAAPPPARTPPATSLTRRDSFNSWSSDEETNLMMCKMRQFFKTMVAGGSSPSSRPSPRPTAAATSPRARRCKPPQLVHFENELTRLMKTVPGIRDDQVKEIVEYLSSEDAWSDSYDSSDYTSSDLEVAVTATSKSALQQQISDSCKRIISKFDAASADGEGDEGDGGITAADETTPPPHHKDTTALVYHKLVASFEKMATGPTAAAATTAHGSPPLIAKVMHHIGSRLVALMHEVSGGEGGGGNRPPMASPRAKHYHRRLQHKISSASSTTTEDDFPAAEAPTPQPPPSLLLLPRSRSHDLLLGESGSSQQAAAAAAAAADERDASDGERFSWRGSFESALVACDSRNKLPLLGHEASALAAKRRSAGDLLFGRRSPSREQLDRVRSCGSIGSEDRLWVVAARPNRRRSSVPDASCGSGGSADGEDEEDEETVRPRGLRTGGAPTTGSLPRLPTVAVPGGGGGGGGMQKSQSMQQFSPQQNAKSARYRPPGFCRLTATAPKRAASAPGLQPAHQRRGRRSQQANVPSDDTATLSEAHSSPMLPTRGGGGGKSSTPSPVASAARRNVSSSAASCQEWQQDEDNDRVVGLHSRTSLSSLGVRSDSMASIYSGAGEGRYGTVAVRGQIEFGLQYNYKAGDLEIQIKQCKDLAPVDAKRNRSDPYVKVYLLPDKSKSGKRKTKVKKHTLNPIFDECLKFHVSLNGLETRTLWLTVWHSDMFGRNDFLGEVMITLEDKVFDDPAPKCYNLQERSEPFEDVASYKGDVLVCLKFVPPDMTIQKKGKRSRGALHVLVKEAKSLTAVKAHGSSDPFCKSYLLPDKGRNSKQKTPVARKTVNPVWNYKFVYDDVTLQELAERCLELTVWDHDRLASNEFLGGVRFSLGTGKHYGKSVDWMDATGRELSLWKNMLERPNFWVEGCLPLRPSLDTRVT